MTLETTLTNIFIEGNVIDQGVSSNGSPITYNYTNRAQISGSSNISGNTFANPTASENMLDITAGSCIITNNKFIRASTTISSYINNAGSGDQIITNNIFDNSTIDGTNDIIVSNLTETSIYKDNKNQVIYIPVSVVPALLGTDTSNFFKFGHFDATNFGLGGTGGGSGLRFDNAYIGRLAYRGDIALTQASANFYLDLTNHIPVGASIIDSKIGLYAPTVGATIAGTNEFITNLISQNVNRANYAAGTNSILDVKNNIGTVNETDTATYSPLVLSNLNSTTQYLQNTPTTPSFFCNNGNFSIIFTMALVVTGSSSDETVFQISPVVLKCIW
jgi:hypothetical protein